MILNETVTSLLHGACTTHCAIVIEQEKKVNLSYRKRDNEAAKRITFQGHFQEHLALQIAHNCNERNNASTGHFSTYPTTRAPIAEWRKKVK